jgi:hypothetical protein
MYARKLFTLIATLLLFALPAAAEAPWTLAPGIATEGNCTFSSTFTTCFAEFDANENSVIMDTRICENYSVHYISDVDADGTFATTANVMCSLSPTLSANTSEIVNNATLTGDPSTGLDVLAGYDCPWVWIDIATLDPGDIARVSLQCFKRRW